jgi:hypothetical protein
MNKIKRVLLIIAFCSPLYAHKEPTHQYIIKEAYSLLVHHLGTSIPEFDKHILGYNGLCTEGEFDNLADFHWQYSTVAGGAWSEDIQDPIRFMHEKDIFFGLGKGSLTSINHFWDPDSKNPQYNESFRLTLNHNPWPYSWWDFSVCSMAHNLDFYIDTDLMAYKKAIIYLGIKEYKPKITDYAFFTCKGQSIMSPIYFGYSLSDWYHDYFQYGDTVLQNRKKDIIYQFIGRVCHLLGDMSIPAHVHCDEHGLWHDPYEDAMNYKEWEGNKMSPCIDEDKNISSAQERVEFWNAEKIFSEKGSIVNPWCYPADQNPYWFLFYTTAQIADHFASNRSNGDDDYQHIGEIDDILSFDRNAIQKGPVESFFYPGNPEASGYAHKEEDLLAIRDITFPYVIRATAGLLYLFATEFGLINEHSEKCPRTLTLKDAILQAPNYLFTVSDSLFAGNESKPLIVSKKSQLVELRAQKTILLNPGFSAEKGSNVHAYIGACSSCTPEEKSLIVENKKPFITSEIMSTVQIHDKQGFEFTENLSSNCSSTCCNNPEILKMRICDIYNQKINEWNAYESTSDGTDFIESVKPLLIKGLYSIDITFKNGNFQKRSLTIM